MDYKELIEAYRSYADRWERGEQILLTGEMRLQNTMREAADAIETLMTERDAAQKQAQDLQIQWDMYGGDEGVTATFQKAEERDAAVEDLRGMCWCCAHGRKYENGLPWSKATTCEHMRDLGVVARSGGKCKCQFWKWRGPQKESESDGQA